MSVRPYRGSFEPVGVAHPVTSRPSNHWQPRHAPCAIEGTASRTTPGCWAGHSAGSVPWTASYPQRISSRWFHSLRAMFTPLVLIFQAIQGRTRWGGNIALKYGPQSDEGAVYESLQPSFSELARSGTDWKYGCHPTSSGNSDSDNPAVGVWLASVGSEEAMGSAARSVDGSGGFGHRPVLAPASA